VTGRVSKLERDAKKWTEQVLVYQGSEKGPGALYQFSAKGNISDSDKHLIEAVP